MNAYCLKCDSRHTILELVAGDPPDTALPPEWKGHPLPSLLAVERREQLQELLAEAPEGRVLLLDELPLQRGGEAAFALLPVEQGLFAGLAESAAAAQQVLLEGLAQLADRSADTLQRLRERMLAARPLENVGLITGDFTHALNNHINTILTNAEFAGIMKDDDPAELDESLSAIESAAIQAGGLLRQVLALSGRRELELEPIQLSQLLEDALALVRQQYPDLTAHLQEPAEAWDGTVEGNGQQLQGALAEMLLYAAGQAAPTPPEVAIAMEKTELTREQIAGAYTAPQTRPGPVLRVTVRTPAPANTEGPSPSHDPMELVRQKGGFQLAAIIAVAKSHRGAFRLPPADGETVLQLDLPFSHPG